MRIVFAGTPEFACVALTAILRAGLDVRLVLTQPDRPAGRGLRLQASPVAQLASAHGIAQGKPRSLRMDGNYPQDAIQARRAIEAAQADVMVVAAYGLILPHWALSTPAHGCLNVHASLLPRWRGAAPIHRAIAAGDAQTGITIMQMNVGLDTGDILLARSEPILDNDTTGSLHDRLAQLGGDLIVQALGQLAHLASQRMAQPAQGVTYAAKIDKAEARIDWSQSAQGIARWIRALDPGPGAHCVVNGENLKLWSAEAIELHGTSAPPGTVVAAGATGIAIACGQSALWVSQLQRAGGRRLSAADFLRGFALMPGMVLS